MATTRTTKKAEYTGEEKEEVKVTPEVAEETGKKKAPVNILDALLGSDVNKIKLPTKQIEITRLSELYGAPFYVTVQALSPSKWEEVQDMAVQVHGKDVDLDSNLLQLFVVLESTLDPNGKLLFKNKELISHFGCVTPKDLARKILLSGEILSIYSEISEISGFGDGSIKEVKNS